MLWRCSCMHCFVFFSPALPGIQNKIFIFLNGTQGDDFHTPGIYTPCPALQRFSAARMKKCLSPALLSSPDGRNLAQLSRFSADSLPAACFSLPGSSPAPGTPWGYAVPRFCLVTSPDIPKIQKGVVFCWGSPPGIDRYRFTFQSIYSRSIVVL